MIKRVEKSDVILVKVYSTESEINTSSFALIQIGEVKQLALELNKEIVALREKFERNSLYQLSAFNYNCLYVDERDESTTPEEFQEVLEEILINDETYCYVEVDTDALEEIESLNSDVDLLLVDASTISFSAYIKHTSIKLTTASISISYIK